MKLGIMQPYFLPYLGYFSLIKNTDEFILFDTPQFIRHGWIERNRILKQNGGSTYISVPLLKHEQTISIKDIRIDNKFDWKTKIMSQLTFYKKGSPYYYKTIELLKDIFMEEYEDIVTLNRVCLQKICNYLGITREFQVFSQMGLEIEKVHASDEWALNICRAMPGVTEYWNPPGGKSFFDRNKYEKAGISLKFLNIRLGEYHQKSIMFEPGLSIIDAMMFNSPERINEMLDDYKLELNWRCRDDFEKTGI